MKPLLHSIQFHYRFDGKKYAEIYCIYYESDFTRKKDIFMPPIIFKENTHIGKTYLSLSNNRNEFSNLHFRNINDIV